jgi:hypothetical protein
MRAAEKARAQGGNPDSIEALATATAGPVEIGGFKLMPASQGTIWTLQRLAREFSAWADAVAMPAAAAGAPDGTRELLELGLSTLAFCDARGCWQEMEAGDLPRLIVRAEAMMFDVPVETSLRLEAHFRHQMERIRALNPEADPMPGKPPAGENGKSPEMQTPPAATA